MFSIKNKFIRQIFGSVVDLLPIFIVIFIFQVFILRQPIPNIADIAIGTIFIILGLTFFIQGLEKSLFPVGETMAYSFARKGSLFWLLTFAFSLGFGTTVAEPALIAVADEAARIAAEAGAIEQSELAIDDYAFGLRYTVAFSVGIAILIGVLRIIRGWPLQYLIIPGYIGVVAMTAFAPDTIIGIAYDSGGVTTGTVTVPLVTALGVGLSSAIAGRNPMIDGFGLIAIASLTPIIFVMAYGMFL
ncbi:MAG: hypothetical protein A6F71_00420 [Cycloclasticus sp. symbiont of Poecilosclerida sp. M]|nr:MAG: hypothetical protein A6F71_00420 [Cycloclasticus sp. symbiont of Poecilosclerida sp. M]